MTDKWKSVVVSPGSSLQEAIARIDASGLQIAIVLNDDGRLAGLLTDGDVRRAILRGTGLNIPLSEVMNRNVMSVHQAVQRPQMLALMRQKVVHHLPIIDDDERVVGLATMDEFFAAPTRPNWVVLMAGGLGTRLRPLTEHVPKPLLPVGGKPILESIVESFAEQGFRHLFLSVNYRADMIRNHFGDGERWGVEIQYLQETQQLGTAGGLLLLPELPSEPVLVMNGDLLTRINFDRMLDFHHAQRATATMAVRDFEMQIPYGVVNVQGTTIENIEEKPVRSCFVNAGVYVLSPEALNSLPPGRGCDMPDLFQRIKASGKTTTAYPIREYWIDIGRFEEFERANREWSTSDHDR